MPRSKQEIEPDPAVIKQRKRNRASRIRHKEPDRITAEEARFLAEYDAEVRGAAPELANPAPAAPAPAAPDPGHVVPPPPIAEVAAPPVPPAPLPRLPISRLPFLPPPMPTPPRIAVADAMPGAPRSKRWQDKYGEAMGGREMACVMIGGAIHEFCESMSQMIELSGGKPVVAIAEMRPIFVLAADEVLPPHVEATPVLIAAGSAIGISLQAFVRRKQIKEAIDRQPKAKRGGLVAIDGGKPRAAPIAEPEPDRAAPIAEQAAPELAPDAEPVAPIQPADGRPIEQANPDYPPPHDVMARPTVPPGYSGLS